MYLDMLINNKIYQHFPQTFANKRQEELLWSTNNTLWHFSRNDTNSNYTFMLMSRGRLTDAMFWMASRISVETELVSFTYTMLYTKPIPFPSGHTAKPNFLTVCSKDGTWLNSGQRDICRLQSYHGTTYYNGWPPPLPVCLTDPWREITMGALPEGRSLAPEKPEAEKPPWSTYLPHFLSLRMSCIKPLRLQLIT